MIELAAPNCLANHKTANQKQKKLHTPFTFGLEGGEIDYQKACERIDRLMARDPRHEFLSHMKAKILLEKGDLKGAVGILKQLISRQVAAKKRFSGPYIDLASVYEETKDKPALVDLMGRMIERFPDNLKVIREVERMNRAVKDMNVALKVKVALKNIVTNTFVADRRLETLKPTHPSTLKTGECYQMVISTQCFPKFRLLFTNDQCTGDSGMARYVFLPPDFKLVKFFYPETKRYAVVTIEEMMRQHCG
ncbi:MAG: hypothetical protein K2Z81_04325, partial [Cyanobacteria bacterium]|nr:hypothetical protein [Cyanobacteriota bacterium]